MRYLTMNSLVLCCASVLADSAAELAPEQLQAEESGAPGEISVSTGPTLLGRVDAVSQEILDHSTDEYLEGYIQALVDMHFYENKVLVGVKNGEVYLSNLPKNELLANSIISFVTDLARVKSVEVNKDSISEQIELKKKYLERPRVVGVWFPQSTVLFPPLIADPRNPTNSVAYRFGDQVVGKSAVAVSIGDDFPIFRWKDILKWHGDMQIGIQGAVWAVFNYDNIPNNNSNNFSELVNADYYVGIPLTYAFDRWAFRLRVYHISGHLGDEFIVDHPEYVYLRVNPSYEAIDFFASYQFSGSFRGYFGPGVIPHSDPTFKLKPLYLQYGLELRLFGRKRPYHGLYETPFFAMHLANYQQHHWTLDATFMLGYEWSKLQGSGRKARVFLEYHQGFSYEGQFFNERTKYGQVGFSWGW